MLEKIRKMKNEKGFTLVELIVVLVILALLAALLIPSLTGYINKANTDSMQAETRSAVLAAQTLSSEYYAKERKLATFGADPLTADKIKNLAEVPGTIEDVTLFNGTDDKAARVKTLKYTSGGQTCTYTCGADGKVTYEVVATGTTSAATSNVTP